MLAKTRFRIISFKLTFCSFASAWSSGMPLCRSRQHKAYIARRTRQRSLQLFSLLLHHDNCGARRNLQRAGRHLRIRLLRRRRHQPAGIGNVHRRRNCAARLHVGHDNGPLSRWSLEHGISMRSIRANAGSQGIAEFCVPYPRLVLATQFVDLFFHRPASRENR